MLRSVHVARRRDDYQRRALAAGVPVTRPEERATAEYGELEALIRREIRQLSLARSLGRLGTEQHSAIKAMFRAGSEWEPMIKLLTALLALVVAGIGLYRLLH